MLISQNTSSFPLPSESVLNLNLWTSNLAFPLNYENQIIAYNVLVPHSINRIPCFFSLYRGQFNKGGSCKLQLPHVWFKQKFSTAKFNKGGSCKLQFSQVKFKMFQLSPSSNRAGKRERERNLKNQFLKKILKKIDFVYFWVFHDNSNLG